jgi:pyruvate formate lyase activating enzyme
VVPVRATSRNLDGQKIFIFSKASDRLFYDKTGGGVTFSGGEPLSQAKFLIAMLKSCKKKRIHTALETCGHGDAKALLEASIYLDLIHFDIKHLDPEIHKSGTGVSNDVILKNLKKLDAKGIELIIRVPVVPGYNDSEEHIRAIAEFCATLRSVKKVELLPYHNLGAGKYISIGSEYELKHLKGPDKLHSAKLAAIVNEVGVEHGFNCEIVHA